MRGATFLAALLCGGAFAQDAETGAAERAFVEIETARDTCFVDESVRVKVRAGFDAEFLRANVVPMFRREMDVPARIDAPWLRTLAGALVVRDAPDADGVSVAVNDEVVRAARGADRTIGGRAFTVIEIEATIVPGGPGELVLAAPALQFAYASRFDDDFVRGRTAEDRREARVEGKPRTLRASALPAAGRPPEFAGAIGRFEVRAETAARSVAANETFRVTLTISADGASNLARLPAPRLDGLAGFHVYGAIDAGGAIEARRAARRTIVYDLAALGPDVKELPAIRFASFDPAPPGAYRTTATEPIPLTVRAAEGGSNAAAEPGTAKGDPSAPDRTVFVVIAIAIAIGAALVVAWRRAPAARAVDAESQRAEGAIAAFRARIAVPGADVSDAFAEFLGAHLRCNSAAVIAPDLQGRLTAAGLTENLAIRAAALIERLVATRYGGETSASDAAEVRALAVELDADFRRSAGARQRLA